MWNGLIMDRGAKHYRQMGNSLWLFFYLIINASRTTGSVKRKIETIIEDTGISKRTLLRWLTTLKKHKYIITVNTGRNLYISIKKWKTFQDMPDMSPLKSHDWHTRSDKCGTSEEAEHGHFFPQVSQNQENNSSPYKVTLKDIKKNVNVLNNIHINRTYKERSEILAYDICRVFHDEKNIKLYLSYTRKYSEKIILKAYQEAKEMSPYKVKKSKGALFTYLVKLYAQKEGHS